MDTKEKQDYKRFNKSKLIWDSTIETAFMEGVEKGIEKGIEKTIVEFIVSAYSKGIDLPTIAELVNLPKSNVVSILTEKDLM
jgi:predicted transposase/invertase (TIGR01784 family)